MKRLKVVPSQYNAFIKSTTHGMEDALKGQFYEYYCYNELLQNNDDINIVKANFFERKSKGNFIHSNEGKILYISRNTSVAEFDVLGIKNNTIYWWEITRSRKLNSKGFKRYKSKLALLNKVFDKYNKYFCLIIPYEVQNDFPYNYKIIPEPDYKEYFDNGYFKFNKNIKNFISLYDFEKKSSGYDYIDDVITYSHDYFNNKNIDVIELLENNLCVERLYDINEIKYSKFKYFDIKHNNSGFIEIMGNQIYIDNILIHGQKKYIIEHEIKALLKRLEYTLQ